MSHGHTPKTIEDRLGTEDDDLQRLVLSVFLAFLIIPAINDTIQEVGSPDEGGYGGHH